jgi:hypothetical protein
MCPTKQTRDSTPNSDVRKVSKIPVALNNERRELDNQINELINK